MARVGPQRHRKKKWLPKCIFLHCCIKELPDVGSCEPKHVVQCYVTFKRFVGRGIAVVCEIYLCQQRHTKPLYISYEISVAYCFF